MGNQLWTSPVTGIRRRGTKLIELRKHFESSITVEAIYEPLQSCPVDSNPEEVVNVLTQRGFDVCGVKESSTFDIHRYVSTSSLKSAGSIADVAYPILSSNLVSEKTALADALQILAEDHWKFVLVGSSVGGIITQWDFNKPPARVYFFGILSLFEQHLNLWLQSAHTEREIKNLVGVDKYQRAKSIQGQKRSRGISTSLVDNFDIGDKQILLVQSKDTLQLLEIDEEYLGFMENIVRFRNALMHAASTVLDEMEWSDVAGLICSIEGLLIKSDHVIEQNALRRKERDSEHLVVSA